MRIGQGYDAHRFAENRRLVLCGVDIPHQTGLLGHSDADVATHAVCDALLGAAALGDIGLHFPPSDPQWKDAKSILLLRRVVGLLEADGFSVCNIDVTIIAEAPRLAPYIDEMRQNIAEAVGVALDSVSVKATTEEGMGFTGRREGMAALAVALIE